MKTVTGIQGFLRWPHPRHFENRLGRTSILCAGFIVSVYFEAAFISDWQNLSFFIVMLSPFHFGALAITVCLFTWIGDIRAYFNIVSVYSLLICSFGLFWGYLLMSFYLSDGFP